jgi:N-acetylglucosaminyl-diphospho-decaprenol L-rhamnosyltransferase
VLTIVIVSFNARADLERCLASLSEAPPREPHEIVIVDNASTDGSADAARRARPDATVVALAENVGFARANNVAMRQTRGELVLLLNSDTIVPAGAIDALVEALRETPGAAIAGPRLVDADGRPELSFGRMVDPFNELRQQRLARLLAEQGLDAVLAESALPPDRAFPDWVSGACLLVRRDAAEAAGLLDERYFMYLEDVDFCAAIRALGRSVRYVPRVVVTHVGGRSRRAAPAATQTAYRRSQVAFYEKHHPRWTPLLRLFLRLKGELPEGGLRATPPRAERGE